MLPNKTVGLVESSPLAVIRLRMADQSCSRRSQTNSKQLQYYGCTADKCIRIGYLPSTCQQADPHADTKMDPGKRVLWQDRLRRTRAAAHAHASDLARQAMR